MHRWGRNDVFLLRETGIFERRAVGHRGIQAAENPWRLLEQREPFLGDAADDLGTHATAALLESRVNLDEAWYWIGFLAIYDALFLVISLWTFEALVIE